MPESYSAEDLYAFLAFLGEKGLMPAATAQAIAVASRTVLGVLEPSEQADLSGIDIDGVIRRFTNKRGREFTPNTLKEYGRRVHRAVDLFTEWRNNPSGFAVKTRAPAPARRKEPSRANDAAEYVSEPEAIAVSLDTGYQTRVPVRPGVVLTISNIPNDLTPVEAGRLAEFVKMLAVS